MREVINPRFGVAPIGNSKRPVFADLYALAGRFISIETDPRVRDSVRSHFAAWHIELIENHQPTRPHITISIMRGTPPACPEHLESFLVAQDGRCYSDANTYFFVDGESVVQA